MSCIVIDMRTYRQVSSTPETTEQQINRRVLDAMRGKAKGETIAMAQLRALRIMRCEPTTIEHALHRAISWARAQNSDPQP